MGPAKIALALLLRVTFFQKSLAQGLESLERAAVDNLTGYDRRFI
jgi:hypothetical protein